MNKKFKFILALSSLSILISCGGGGGDSASTTVVEAKRTDIVCTEIANKSDLDNAPIYSFGGLQSNWKNEATVPGKTSAQDFVFAVANFSAVAKDNNDIALKSKVVSSIYRWASANAFKGSRWCWSPATGWDPACTQWVDPNGNDLSAIQDNNFVMEKVESIRRSYSLISDWSKTNEPIKHETIMNWLKYWDENTPNPDNVFFGLGMGRYHWEIQRVTDAEGVQATIPLIKNLMAGIILLMNDDGSFVDRTTRGNRALWYHYSSINEVMTSMYLAKQAGVEINPVIEARLHRGVDIFLKTLDNPKYILPWAAVGYNNGGDGTQQEFYNGVPNDFTRWYDNQYAGSWIYLYSNWYPSNANAIKLKQIVPGTAKSAQIDTQFGAPLGCINY